MRVAVMGTGMVGRVLSARLAELGHDVAMGTRNVAVTLAKTESDRMGNPPMSQWQGEHPVVQLMTFADAAQHGELVINATSGDATLAVLEAAGTANLAGKVLIDISNALDHSSGFPPTLSVCNTDSVAEQVQRAFPEARVVKALNTMNCLVMADPSRLPGDHDVFIAGDDESAKQVVRSLLGQFGWPAQNVIDLGGISQARGPEMYLPLWLRLMQTLGTSEFNIKVVR
jgi:predicted dinucleotide-binding enzyme